MKIKCHCPCHSSKGLVKHRKACCIDGFINIPDSLEHLKPKEKEKILCLDCLNANCCSYEGEPKIKCEFYVDPN